MNQNRHQYIWLLLISLACGTTSFDPQYKKYNIKSKKTRKLNTGWVGEDHGELMKQLLLSDHVVILSDDRTISATGNGEQRSYTYTQNGVAVNINTSSLEIQKHINDRMINYTIDVEYAFDDLNIAH